MNKNVLFSILIFTAQFDLEENSIQILFDFKSDFY